MYEIDDTINEHKGLIFDCIHKFHLSDDQEAESIGYWALLRAIQTYDETQKAKISTYATVCIYNALGNYVRELKRKRQLELVSYNAPAFANSKEEYAEHLPVHTQVRSLEESYIKNEYYVFIKRIVQEEKNKLTNPTIYTVVDIWIDSDFIKDTKEIAKEAGVSQSYVSQVLNRFRYSLRKRLEEYNE